MSQKLIRFNSKLNTANAKKKTMFVGKVNGKALHADYMVIENVCHMLSGTVMNGLLYGDDVFNLLADDLMKSNARIPAPMSHPSDESGAFVSADDPITFPAHNIGAYDSDWSVSGDKLMSNTYIPVDSIENPKVGNEWFSNSIKNGLPIDRSTGLFLSVNDATGYGRDGEPYEAEVSEIFELNHSAILNPDIEPGAKDNGSGVGMFTNAKGDKVEIGECDILINSFAPAMKLPLAPIDYIFNESEALQRIKVYTNSTDKPSTSFRKFFLAYDINNTQSFDGYTGLFADIIDNRPHAVKSQVSNNESDHAKTYVNRFDSELKGNKQSFVKSAINKLFSLMGGEQSAVNESDFVYRGKNDIMYIQQYNTEGGELSFTGEPVEVIKIANEYKPIINNNTTESVMDKAELIALLTANGITANADMTDDELKAKLKKKLEGKSEDKKLDEVANTATTDAIAALTATVNSLSAQITANADKELDSAVASVVAMNKGIDEATAKTMGLASCNAFLAANGHVAFNARGTQSIVNKDDSCLSLGLPNSES